jgi:GntR family transcriptional regulator
MPTKPAYIEVFEALQGLIESMAANSLMPTEQQLTKRFRVSRVTIRRALGLLERGGRISRERGRGTIVNPQKITRRIVPVCPLEHDMREQGLRLETKLLDYQAKTRPPKHIACRLRLRSQATVGYLSFLRLIEDRIICHEWRYLPPALAKRFDPALLEATVLFDLLQQLAGARITNVRWETEIVPVSFEVSAALGVKPGTLVVVNTFTDYLENGEPADVGATTYRVDRVNFKIEA